jgi:plasmid stabilization system protein ParE
MEIRWSPEAARDLERILLRIQKDNPAASREVVKTPMTVAPLLRPFLTVDVSAG